MKRLGRLFSGLCWIEMAFFGASWRFRTLIPALYRVSVALIQSKGPIKFGYE
jgi:hypothetical protein